MAARDRSWTHGDVSALPRSLSRQISSFHATLRSCCGCTPGSPRVTTPPRTSSSRTRSNASRKRSQNSNACPSYSVLPGSRRRIEHAHACKSRGRDLIQYEIKCAFGTCELPTDHRHWPLAICGINVGVAEDRFFVMGAPRMLRNACPTRLARAIGPVDDVQAAGNKAQLLPIGKTVYSADMLDREQLHSRARRQVGGEIFATNAPRRRQRLWVAQQNVEDFVARLDIQRRPGEGAQEQLLLPGRQSGQPSMDVVMQRHRTVQEERTMRENCILLAGAMEPRGPMSPVSEAAGHRHVAPSVAPPAPTRQRPKPLKRRKPRHRGAPSNAPERIRTSDLRFRSSALVGGLPVVVGFSCGWAVSPKVRNARSGTYSGHGQSRAPLHELLTRRPVGTPDRRCERPPLLPSGVRREGDRGRAAENL